MASFKALGDFLDDYLELPVTGKDGVERIYRIEDPAAEDGLRVERVTSMAARLAMGGSAADAQALDDDEELDLYRLILGSTHDRLRAEVSWSRFKHVALTAMFWITADQKTAEAYWATGDNPGKAVPNRAARRQRKPGSSASAAASTTRSRSSTSGTRAARPRKAKPKT